MYSELNSVADEVKKIEGKVVEISQLVDVFSEKILQQVTSYINQIKYFSTFWWLDFRVNNQPLSSPSIHA